MPKLVPAVTACLHGSTSPDGACSVPPDPAVAAGALGVLEALVSLLRSTMRPHVKKVEGATVLWLQVRSCGGELTWEHRIGPRIRFNLIMT